jgi:hypothetical protein
MMLLFKCNRLMLCRPLVITEYRTTMKSFRPTKPVSTESTFRFWTYTACTVILFKIPPVILCWKLFYTNYWNLITAVFERTSIYLLWARKFTFTAHPPTLDGLLNAGYQQDSSNRLDASEAHVGLFFHAHITYKRTDRIPKTTLSDAGEFKTYKPAKVSRLVFSKSQSNWENCRSWRKEANTAF